MPLITPRRAVLTARHFGHLHSFTIRPGRSGAVLVAACTFTDRHAASGYAAFAARMSGRNVALRHVNPSRTAFSVSCPVAGETAPSAFPRPMIPCRDASASYLSTLLEHYGYPPRRTTSRGHGLPPSLD